MNFKGLETNNCGITIYIQEDVTLYSLFYLETALRAPGGDTSHHQVRHQVYLEGLVFNTEYN
jgi:hypothetical protein